MRLSLKNIGKINEASVKIKGITVIAGENDTGKSVAGRALFSVFNSFRDSGVRIKQVRVESIAETALLKNDDSLIKDKLIGSVDQYDENIQKYVEREDFTCIIHQISR